MPANPDSSAVAENEAMKSGVTNARSTGWWGIGKPTKKRIPDSLANSVDLAACCLVELVAEAGTVHRRQVGEPAQRRATVDGEALAGRPLRLGPEEVADGPSDVLGLTLTRDRLLDHVRVDDLLVGE